jgi:hypothetical protein
MFREEPLTASPRYRTFAWRRSEPVCTENLIRIDCVTESPKR